MKIAYIIPSLNKKGPIIVVKEIVNGLIKLGISKNDIIIYYFDESKGVDFPVKTKKIKFWDKIYKDNEYDIIHSHMIRPDIFLLKEIIINKILFKNIKFNSVSTLHQRNFENFYYETHNYLFSVLISKLWEFILSFFDKIVVLSESMKSYYKERIIHSKEKIVVNYNGRTIPDFNKNEIEKFHGSQTKCILLGSVCNINKRKNLDKVIMAIKDLENAEYYIIGDGPEKYKLQNMVNELKIKNRVHFIGFKNNVLDYFQLFNIFILPSKSEGMSLSLIEAAAMKKTIICSKIDANLDMFNVNEAIFIDSDDIDGIKNAIYIAANSDQYSKAAYKKYIEKYTGIAMARRYYELYSDLVKEKE